jgi:hypothetical protein
MFVSILLRINFVTYKECLYKECHGTVVPARKATWASGLYDNPMPGSTLSLQSGIYEFGYCFKWQPDVLTIELYKTVEYEFEYALIPVRTLNPMNMKDHIRPPSDFFSQIYVHLMYIT